MSDFSKKYFAFLDGEQKGPFELRQLVAAGVRPSTYVWCKGMDDWQRADEIADIRELFLDHLSSGRENPQPEIVEEAPKPQQEAVDDENPKQRPPRFARFGVELTPIEEIKPNMDNPPQVSMALAVIATLICFPPTGIASVIFTSKALGCWQKVQKATDETERENLKIRCHEYERQAKMWLGITLAFGLIFWTFLISLLF